jgi:hypothetical protein
LKSGEAGMSDPLAYPLSYKLLQECLKDGNLYYIEIMELIKWTRIGHNLYENDLIDKVIATTSDEGQMVGLEKKELCSYFSLKLSNFRF